MSLFKGILNFIKKPVAFVAKAAGALVGLPALGVAASKLITSIGGAPKAKEIAAKVAETGVIDTQKLATTLEKSGIEATSANVSSLTGAIKEVVKADPTNPLNTDSSIAVNDSAKKLSVSFKVWNYVKSYWFLVLPSGLLVAYLIYKQFKK